VCCLTTLTIANRGLWIKNIGTLKVYNLGICKLQNVWFAPNDRFTAPGFRVAWLKNGSQFGRQTALAIRLATPQQKSFVHCSLPDHNR
jgi:hypothetical protein